MCLLAVLLLQCWSSLFLYLGNGLLIFVFLYSIIMAATVSLGRLSASSICSIFSLCMESKVLEKLTNNIVDSRFFACTHSKNLMDSQNLWCHESISNILDCLSSTESIILSIWFCMYSVCSFRYILANSFCTFLSFRALVFVRFFPVLALCLVSMHSAAVSLMKFSYPSFGVCVSVFSCSASNLFLSFNAYVSLISLLLSRDQSVYTGCCSGCIPS